MAFWYGGVSPNRDPFQPEGHTRMALYGLLVRPSGVMFCYGLLVWPPPPPRKTATIADGTHPTGMHSCLCYYCVAFLVASGTDSKLVFTESCCEKECSWSFFLH